MGHGTSKISKSVNLSKNLRDWLKYRNPKLAFA